MQNQIFNLRILIPLFILATTSCKSPLDKKYNPDNIFYDLKEIDKEKRKIIQSVHEKIQSSDQVLGIDKSYIKSMKYIDIYETVSDSIESTRKYLKKFGKKAYLEIVRANIKSHLSLRQRKQDKKVESNRTKFELKIRSAVTKFDSDEINSPSEIGLTINEGILKFDPSKNIYLKNYLEYISSIFYFVTFDCYEPDFVKIESFMRNIYYENGDIKIETSDSKKGESILIGNDVPCEEIGNIELVHYGMSLDQNELDEKFPLSVKPEIELENSTIKELLREYSINLDSLINKIPGEDIIKFYPEKIDQLIQLDDEVADTEILYKRYLEIKER